MLPRRKEVIYVPGSEGAILKFEKITIADDRQSYIAAAFLMCLVGKSFHKRLADPQTVRRAIKCDMMIHHIILYHL